MWNGADGGGAELGPAGGRGCCRIRRCSATVWCLVPGGVFTLNVGQSTHLYRVFDRTFTEKDRKKLFNLQKPKMV